jgi:hypothetical protein
MDMARWITAFAGMTLFLYYHCRPDDLSCEALAKEESRDLARHGDRFRLPPE